MNYDSVLISGTPASGKDTLTKSLLEYDRSLCYFLKHKSSNIKKSSDDGKYIYISKEEFKKMVVIGEFVQHHDRYGNSYGISKKSINKIISVGKKPIIHIGDYSNLKTIIKSNILKAPLKILIFTNESQTRIRLTKRHSYNNIEVTQRMIAYYEDLSCMTRIIKNQPLKFNLLFINNYYSPIEASKELIENMKIVNLDNDVTSEVLKEVQKVEFSKSS